MKGPEGLGRIEGGYAMIAAAAMRMSERKERKPAPSTKSQADSPRQSASPKERHRDKLDSTRR